jgi:hypothetical protein
MELYMKTLILSICASVCASAAVATPAIVEPIPAESSSDGALVLLALIGIVIASTALGGVATRNSTDMDIDPTDINDSFGH